MLTWKIGDVRVTRVVELEGRAPQTPQLGLLLGIKLPAGLLGADQGTQGGLVA